MNVFNDIHALRKYLNEVNSEASKCDKSTETKNSVFLSFSLLKKLSKLVI